MGAAAPPPPNYRGAAEQTAQSGAEMNRLNTQNAYGGGVQFGAEGVRQTLTGPLGDLSQSLMGQAGSAMGSPFNPTLPQVGSGQEAIDAAYRASTSRLDPMWAQREEAQRTQLINQGLDPSSAAYREQMDQLGKQRNDAYGQAYGQAVGLGQSQQQLDAQRRQQAYAEALQGRQLPLQDLQQLRALTEGQPQYNQVAGPDYYGAARDQYGVDWDRYQYGQDQINQRIGAGVNIASVLARLGLFGG